MVKPSKWGKLLLGDVLVIIFALLFVAYLFKSLWHNEQAAKLQIRLGDKIYATYSLDQNRDINIQGPIGVTRIEIANGKARFASSPCPNQYCVHQGWLNHKGHAAICLPNQVSMELLGGKKPFDSLNY
ncbi:MAG: NusG domain II-containing protein [Candidatus Methylopumilus sp.]|nr:NusG domain II-containing protein [Candidatus Methylopumilus sp.]